MEAASGVAGLISLAAVSLEGIKNLRGFCLDFEHVNTDINDTANDLESLAAVLERLKTIQIGEGTQASTLGLLQRTITNCHNDIERWRTTVNAAEFNAKKGPRRLLARLTSSFDFGRRGELRQKIASHRSQLEVALGIIGREADTYHSARLRNLEQVQDRHFAQSMQRMEAGIGSLRLTQRSLEDMERRLGSMQQQLERTSASSLPTTCFNKRSRARRKAPKERRARYGETSRRKMPAQRATVVPQESPQMFMRVVKTAYLVQEMNGRPLIEMLAIADERFESANQHTKIAMIRFLQGLRLLIWLLRPGMIATALTQAGGKGESPGAILNNGGLNTRYKRHAVCSDFLRWQQFWLVQEVYGSSKGHVMPSDPAHSYFMSTEYGRDLFQHFLSLSKYYKRRKGRIPHGPKNRGILNTEQQCLAPSTKQPGDSLKVALYKRRLASSQEFQSEATTSDEVALQNVSSCAADNSSVHNDLYKTRACPSSSFFKAPIHQDSGITSCDDPYSTMTLEQSDDQIQLSTPSETLDGLHLLSSTGVEDATWQIHATSDVQWGMEHFISENPAYAQNSMNIDTPTAANDQHYAENPVKRRKLFNQEAQAQDTRYSHKDADTWISTDLSYDNLTDVDVPSPEPLLGRWGNDYSVNQMSISTSPTLDFDISPITTSDECDPEQPLTSYDKQLKLLQDMKRQQSFDQSPARVTDQTIASDLRPLERWRATINVADRARYTTHLYGLILDFRDACLALQSVSDRNVWSYAVKLETEMWISASDTQAYMHRIQQIEDRVKSSTALKKSRSKDGIYRSRKVKLEDAVKPIPVKRPSSAKPASAERPSSEVSGKQSRDPPTVRTRVTRDTPAARKRAMRDQRLTRRCGDSSSSWTLSMGSTSSSSQPSIPRAPVHPKTAFKLRDALAAGRQGLSSR